MRFSRRLGTAIFASAAAFASLSASAHAILTDSTPKPGGTLPAGHAALSFQYNSKIDQGRSRLVLVKPDHSQAVLSIAADPAKPNELDSSVDLTPGDYVIRWQALALDGHITRGDVNFTVKP